MTLSFDLPESLKGHLRSFRRTTVWNHIKIHQICRNYGPDKNLTFKVWPWPWVYLKECFIWHIYMWWRTNGVKLFWNPSTIVEIIVWTNLDGEMDAHTHTRNWDTRTHIHRTVIVTTMCRSSQVDLTTIVWEKVKGLFYIMIQLIIWHRFYRSTTRWSLACCHGSPRSTHYQTIVHFDALKINSCGKHCEKREKLLVTSNFSFSHNVFYPIWHLFSILNAL